MGTLNVNRPSGNQSMPGFSRRATFTIPIPNAAPISANYVLATINAGALANVKIRRINLLNPGAAAGGQKTLFDMVATTAPSSGGTLYVPQSYDPIVTRDAPFSGIVRTGNPVITTAGVSLHIASAFSPAAVAGFVAFTADWQAEILKPPTIPAGANNGLAFRCVNGVAGLASVDLIIEFTEEEY